MQMLQSLIDKAAKVCGGDSKLARRIGVSKQLISMIRAGKRPITPEVAGLCAEVAGEDIAAACVAAMMDSFTQNERGIRLRAEMEKRYFAAVARGVAATLILSAGLILTQETEAKVNGELTVYTSYQPAARQRLHGFATCRKRHQRRRVRCIRRLSISRALGHPVRSHEGNAPIHRQALHQGNQLMLLSA